MAAFEFENPGRADLVLQWSRLEEISRLDGTDREALFEALGDLAGHLDDPFLEVESRQLSDERPRLLTVFEGRGGIGSGTSRQTGYALVTLNGRVFVGNAEELRKIEPVSLQLDEFDPELDDLTSIATTATRLVGDRLDLWIGVRRQPVGGPAETGVYHCLVWLDTEGKPHIEPAVDDAGQKLCARHSAERFPTWFCQWRLSQLPTANLGAELPAEVGAKLQEHSRGGEISRLLWKKGTSGGGTVTPNEDLFLGAIDERLFVMTASGTELPERWSKERIRALDMPDHATAEKPAMVLGLHAHSLIGLDWRIEEDQWTVHRRWAKRVPFLPVTLKFLPVAVNNNDILVADGDGTLHRLVLIEISHVRQAWAGCWEKLGAVDFTTRASLQDLKSEAQRRAWLLGVVEATLDPQHLKTAFGPELAQRLKVLQNLFRSNESDFVLMPSVQLLLHQLAEVEVKDWGLLENDDSLVPSFLYWLYASCAPVMIRGLIDSQVRHLKEKLEVSGRAAAKLLLERSGLTRRDWWNRETVPTDEHAVAWVGYGLERWASAAILAASLRRLPLKQEEDVCTAILPVWPQPNGEGTEEGATVYFAGNGEISLLGVDPFTFQTWKAEPVRASVITEPILFLGWRAGLLAVDRSCQLHIFSRNGLWEQKFQLLPSRGDLRAWAFGLLPEQGGKSRSAAVMGRGLESLLVQGELEGSTYQMIKATTLEIRRVRAMALAGSGKKTVVALGSSLPGAIQILELAEDGEMERIRKPCHIKAGVSCLAFDRVEKPRYLYCGDRAGFVWCVELGQPEARVRWIYKAKSMIRAFCPLTLDGEERLMVGSEDGDLSLLDSGTGRRLWKSQLNAPIQALAVAGPMLVTLMRGGMVTLHELLSMQNREVALEKSLHFLRGLINATALDHRWNHHDADSAAIFRKLLASDSTLSMETVGRALEEAKTRSGKARLLRWLSLKASPDLDRAALLPGLNFRELALLIAYLPDEDTRLDIAIDQELKSRGFVKKLETQGDNSARAREAAWVYWVQRRARQNVALKDIVIEGLAGRWLRLELARLLWTQAQRKTTLGNPQLALFFMALRWPPDLLVELEEIVPREDGGFSGFLKCLAVLCSCLENEEQPGTEALEALGQLVRRGKPDPGQRGERTAQFLGTLALFVQKTSQPRPKVGQDLRPTSRWLSELAVEFQALLQKMAGAASDLGPFFDEFGWLPRAPLADAKEPVTKRLAAVEQSLRSFEKALSHKEGESPKQSPWWILGRRLQLWLWHGLHKWLQLEHQFLIELIRPRLSLLGVTLDDTRILRLSLRAEPDGLRQVQDVTLAFTLLTSKKNSVQSLIHLPSYSALRPAYEFYLEAYMAEDARQVEVKVEMRAAEGYSFEEKWTFSIHEALQQRPVLPVATALPAVFGNFVEEVWAAKARGGLVVIDESLGRGELLRALEQRRAVLFDLDGWMRDYGRGRKYAGRALDLPLWQEAFAEARLRANEQQNPTLVLGPTSETLGRWLKLHQEETLAAWWREVRVPSVFPGRLLVVVSSGHAALLERIGLGHFEKKVLHRFSEESRRRLELARELQQYLEKETKLDPGWAAWLGSDLRLIERALLVTASQGRPPTAPRELFSDPGSRNILQNELARLEPLVLVAVILGALAETLIPFGQAEAGQVSASEHFSNARVHRGKKLVSRGEVLSKEILNRLSSDQRPPLQLSIEGVGLFGVVSCQRSRLDALFQREAKERRQIAFTTAAKQGLGSQLGAVFRAAEPWRSWIRQIYEELPSSSGRDSLAYGQLLGKKRHPTELLDSRSVLAMDTAALAQIVPSASRQDLQILRQYALLLHGSEGDVEAWLKKVFESARVENLEHIQDRHLRPLQEAARTGGWRVLFADGSATLYLWIQQDGEDAKIRFNLALDQVHKIQTSDHLDSMLNPKPPRLALLGPGVESVAPDDERRVGILKLTDVVGAAWDGNLGVSLESRLRSQLSLAAYSPFQLQTALPPGSTLFVGRDKEQEFIHQRIRLSSFLILGARRIGKTSLLNAIYNWTLQQPDLLPFRLDLQGMKTGREVNQGLVENYGTLLGEDPTSTRHPARELALYARSQKRLAVFFLNEVDGVATQDSPALERLRALNDEGLARFVMTGYYTVVHLGDPKAALFHFSSGPHLGGKAMVLSILEEGAARRLLGKLEDPELGLSWASQEDRKAGENLLVERSYRVPWAIQQYAHNLIEHMEEERRIRFRLDDVERVLEGKSGNIVWDYIDTIEYQKLMMPKKGEELISYPEAFRLLLYAIARSRYFLGGRYAPVRDERLRYRSPAEFSFTTAEAIEALLKTHQQLVKLDEFQVLKNYFKAFDFDEALRLLTLTMALEPDPSQNGRWIFSLHIVPLELERVRSPNDPTLDSMVVDLTADLISRIKQGETVQE